MFSVEHSFGNGFTAELTDGQVNALEKLGFAREDVLIYEIRSTRRSC